MPTLGMVSTKCCTAAPSLAPELDEPLDEAMAEKVKDALELESRATAAAMKPTSKHAGDTRHTHTPKLNQQPDPPVWSTGAFCGHLGLSVADNHRDLWPLSPLKNHPT